MANTCLVSSFGKASFQGHLRARLGVSGQGCIVGTFETEELLNREPQSSCEETPFSGKATWIPDAQSSVVGWKVGGWDAGAQSLRARMKVKIKNASLSLSLMATISHLSHLPFL